jgi:hypothetical protein
MRSDLRHVRFTTVARHGGVVVLTVAFAMVTFDIGAQRADQRAAPPNFDVRTARDAAGSAYMARFAGVAAPAGVADRSAARAEGLARLRSEIGSLEVVNSPELGTPEVVGTMPGTGFLTAPAADRVGAMRGFLSAYADAYGLLPGQAENLDLIADYVNPAGNMAWVEFEQRLNGLPVFRGLIRGGFTARGELARTTGALGAGLDPAQLATLPALSSAQAVSAAAASVGWRVAAEALVATGTDRGRVTFARRPMADEARAWLVYFPLAPGVARLAWAAEIWGDPEAFLVLLDAEEGSLLFRKNLTAYQSQAATYRVYNDDSPAPLSPTPVVPGQGTQAPFILPTLQTLIGNEAPNTFNNLGWMTDGNSLTDGNNVEAGIDRDGTDGVDAPVICTPFFGRICDVAFNPQSDEPLTVPYQRGEVIDMFYWTNVYHDRLYRLGFTEAAGNFQNDNFSRGGRSGDRIRAESQDSTSVNNANFSTGVDGVRGRMQMYIFPGAAPDRSSALEHDVLLHELTHGTSNRLHNNAAGLTTLMSVGMGEGWSDFYARALLSTEDEDPAGIYSTGGWVTHRLTAGYTDNYYYGIRRFPYASITQLGANGRPHNPLTFADVDPTQINLTDGAYARNPLTSSASLEVHNLGEIWASALFEVRARFIARLGWSEGNERILQYVTDAMKLDPLNPTMLQGRDAIAAAAAAGGGTEADRLDIWSGFAARGMGVSAQVTSADTGRVVQAFDVPGIMGASTALVTEAIPNGRLDPFERVTVSLCIGNAGVATTGSVTATLLTGGGVQSPSTPQSYGEIAPGETVCRSYALTVSAACGATLTATLRAQESGAAARDLSYRFQVSQPTHFTQNFDAVVSPALPAGWVTTTLAGAVNSWTTISGAADSPFNRAFVADPAGISDNALTSPPIEVPPGLSRLTFRNQFAIDTGFDGGVLEIAIGGGAFQDILVAGGRFVSGGYSSNLFGAEGNPLGVRPAWTGSTGPSYLTTIVTLPAAAAGRSVAFRWRMGTGLTIAGTGWFIDTIALTSFACLRPPVTDLDGDRKSEITVFRPGTGEWLTRNSLTGYQPGATAYQWGLPGDVPVGADFDGDGRLDLTVFRPSTGEWLIRYSSTGYSGATGRYQWGLPGDIPIVADFDLDGKAELTVFRPATGEWWIRYSATGYPTTVIGRYQWGLPGDVPIAADLDGDGRTDITVFRPATGEWLIRYSSTNFGTGAAAGLYQWGLPGDVPISADFDGDGRTDLTVYRPSEGNWFIRYSSQGYATGAASGVYQWGLEGDMPMVADLDGDGKTELTVYRPGTGEWIIRYSSLAYSPATVGIYQWGLAGDTPLP